MPALHARCAKKFHIQTHGCQMNEYDSARMADLLTVQEGMGNDGERGPTDVILINACSIREKAQEKMLASWAAGKASSKANAR